MLININFKVLLLPRIVFNNYLIKASEANIFGVPVDEHFGLVSALFGQNATQIRRLTLKIIDHKLCTRIILNMGHAVVNQIHIFLTSWSFHFSGEDR